MKKKLWLLIIILVLAAVLRLWNLGNIPPSLTQDEAALGYNAYSIFKTGRDEYGKFLPIIFKSFGDFKPGLYIYLDIPFVAALGLNEIAARLPSALAGVLAVYLVYLIAGILFKEDKKIPLITAFVAAVTPWCIYFSRGAWEVNLALTLTLVGIYFFLKSFEKPKLLIFSSLAFALTLLTYQGAKLSSFIVLLSLIAVYWKEFLKIDKKYIISSAVLGFVISIPVIISVFNGQTGRLEVFSIFSYPRPQDYTQAFLNEGGEKIGGLSYYLYHSETLNFTRGILGRYFNHFSGKFLFFEGDYQNPWHSAPYQGMLLVTDIIVLIFGIAAIFRTKIDKSKLFILIWLALSPLPAALTRDQVQSVRALNMAIPMVFVLSLGLNLILSAISKVRIKAILYTMVTVLYMAGIIYFLDAYFVHVPKHYSSYWNYGYREVVEEITKLEKDNKNIVVEQSFAQPYIYFLFYQKYDPLKYQAQASLGSSANPKDVGLVAKLDNISFLDIDWSNLRNHPGSIVVVGFQTPIPNDLNYETIEKINYLNGRDLAFTIIKIK